MPPAKKPATTQKPKRAPAKPKTTTTRRRRTTERKPQRKTLHELGGRVISVYGTRTSRVLIEVPIDAAQELFDGMSLEQAAPSVVMDAVRRDLDDLQARDEALAKSSLAATAVALAYELANPFNSATSKSMCAKELRAIADRLRELAPDEAPEADGVDQLAERREQRRAQAAS